MRILYHYITNTHSKQEFLFMLHLSNFILKNITTITLNFTLLLLLLSSNSFSQTAITPTSGDGSEGNPYQIATIENLYWMSQDSTVWDKHFIQVNDINVRDTREWDNGKGWKPIHFSGSYNGNDFNIDSLYINRPDTFDIGFIGHGSSAKVSNLSLVNVNITGGENTGGVIGIGLQSTVKNCFVRGFVKGYRNVGAVAGKLRYDCIIDSSNSEGDISGTWIIGGFAGYLDSAAIIKNSYSEGVASCDSGEAGGFVGFSNDTISNCYSNVGVKGGEIIGGFAASIAERGVVTNCYSVGPVLTGFNDAESIGGFAGRNEGLITRCYSKSNVKSVYLSQFIGGFVGITYGDIFLSYTEGSVYADSGYKVGGFVGDCNKSNIKNCYSRGEVKGFLYSGGFIGSSNNVNSNGKISFCYSTGLVEGENDSGGFSNSSCSHEVIRCFWDKDNSGIDSSADAIGLSTEEMKIDTTYINNYWDFTNIWKIDPDKNDGYPIFRDASVVAITDKGDSKLKKEIPYGIKILNNPIYLNDEFVDFIISTNSPSDVKIVICDNQGEVLDKQKGISHIGDKPRLFSWDLKNLSGEKVTSGTYLVYALIKDRKTGELSKYKSLLGIKR